MKTVLFQKEITKKMEIRAIQYRLQHQKPDKNIQERRYEDSRLYKGYTPVYEQQASFPDQELVNCIVCSNGKAQAAVPSMFAMSSEHPWKIQCTAYDRVGILVQKLNSALTSNDLK